MNQQSIDFFKSIFNDFPNFKVLHINNNYDEIKDITQDLTTSNNGHFTNMEFSDINIELFKLKSSSYTYVILSNCINEVEDKKEFLSSIYTGLENTAQLLILIKKDTTDIYKLFEILDELNFNNTNTIDIFDDYDLVVTKKMRMWV